MSTVQRPVTSVVEIRDFYIEHGLKCSTAYPQSTEEVIVAGW